MQESIFDICQNTATADTLLVMLPCAYAKPKDFIEHGFVAAARAHRILVDILMVELPILQYTNGQAADYLKNNIIQPAHEQGYSRVWMIGISLGGYGAVLYSQKYGKQIAGIFLIAPFLGNRSMIAEIKKMGRATWQAMYQRGIDTDKDLWFWMHNYNNSQIQQSPLYLAYGLQDKFSSSHQLLGSILSPEYVYTMEGGHDWPTWLRLWEAFLERKLFPQF